MSGLQQTVILLLTALDKQSIKTGYRHMRKRNHFAARIFVSVEERQLQSAKHVYVCIFACRLGLLFGLNKNIADLRHVTCSNQLRHRHQPAHCRKVTGSLKTFASPLHHHTIQINQPTRCNNFSSLLLDIYVQLNMFRASSRQSSGAQQLQ